MLGFILFLLCLLIIVILVKMILAELLPGNANAFKIAMLVILLFAVLWLAGLGGWGYVRVWHP